MEQATRIDAGSAPAPESFDLIQFLDGRVRAWGVFEDRSGLLRRRFAVDLNGQWTGSRFAVDEELSFDDGTTERRTWQFERAEGGNFRATATDVIGRVEGRCEGGSARMRYRLRMRLKGRALTVDLDDRYYRVDGERLLNRATVSKFGVRIGELTIMFERLAKPGMAMGQRGDSERVAA